MAFTKKDEKITHDFQKYLATPKDNRREVWGFNTQKAFASAYGVTEQTLMNWKRDPEFMDGVEIVRRRQLDEALSDIYQTLIRRAIEGDFQFVQLALKVSGRFNEKKDITITDKTTEDLSTLSDNDLSEMMASYMAAQQSMVDKGVTKEEIKRELSKVLRGEIDA
jgi:hypothetical protein